MTAGPVPPVIPSSVLGAPRSGPANRSKLPLPELVGRDTGATLCGTAAIDCNGRVVEATVLAALGWSPGTRLDIRVCGGLVLVTADEQAVFQLTRPGQLRLPAPVRHRCALVPGCRVLLVADPAAARLVVHPPAALHTMINQFHAAVLGGTAA